MQRTLVLLKPDCVERRLISEVIRRVELKSLNIIGMKMVLITPELAKQHYEEHVEKPFYDELERFMVGAPSIAMVIEGLDAIRALRMMVGPTNCQDAQAGTIRGDMGTSKQRNLVHASDSEDSARREICLFFSEDEIYSYAPALQEWWKASDEI